MLIDLKSLKKNQIYSIFTQAIIPRPIAWILSDNGEGTFNLAPFSYFNGLSSDPPLVMFSVGKKRDGSKKDTWRNIESRDRFLVHIPGRLNAEEVIASSKPLDFGHSEITEFHISLEKNPGLPLPMVKGSKLVFSCRRYQIMEIGNTPQGLIIGLVESVFADDSVATMNEGRFSLDAKKFDPLARLGGDELAGLGDIFSLPRP